MAYTKLFQSLLTSSIWGADDQHRIVWITLLALADKNGEVQASLPGLARIAVVDVEKVAEAINTFLAPDPFSRTPDDDGRRIEKIEGGWVLLNHAKYREMASREDNKTKNAARQSRFRERRQRNLSVTESNASVTDSNGTVTHNVHIAEAEADTDTEEEKNKSKSVSSETEKRSKAPRKSFDVDVWLESLKTEPIYSHIDIDREVRKAQLWIADHPGRKFTPTFFRKWIDRIEPPIKGATTPIPPQQTEEDAQARDAVHKSMELFYGRTIPR